ncbi:MAG TPA: hypothetical protein P5117_14610 [Spirochaetia bacterium]|nr:hypothetical protein [Spirochaetales bacterium]HRY78960.1 hypothetical protein [Spirochaetia bacterium]HRZ90711.1 hypothetical protein [Spirochaetia bacterium]
MSPARRSLVLLAGALLLALSLTGCSRRLGWGVVLWYFEGTEAAPVPEEEATPDGQDTGTGLEAPSPERVPAGTVVPVFIKSNINHTYVVENPATRKKAEVPVWKIELFRRKREAEARAREFEPSARLYAVALRDGLVLRDEPRNLANQVYRMRRDQSIKLLAKTEGEEVTTGGKPLPGDWYLAMGEDGTRGYVFSNQLRIYDESEGPAAGAAVSGPDPAADLDLLFSRTWRPAYFKTMIEQGRVDLERLGPQFGIFTDAVRRQIRIEYPGASRFFNYTNILPQADGSFRFEGLPLTLRFPDPESLEVTIETDYGAGTHPFAVFDQDIREIVRREELRRANALARMIAEGERFVSDEWGALTISRSGRFTWAAYDKLIPEGIPEYSGEAGAVVLGLFPGPLLAGEWDGGLSLFFDGGARPRADFVYRATPGGLDLQLVRPIDKEWSVVNTLSEPPLSIRFRRSAN